MNTHELLWEDLSHRERLESFLQLLVDSASLAEQRRLIAIDRDQHPTRVEFPSARHTLKRWQLSQVHCYLAKV